MGFDLPLLVGIQKVKLHTVRCYDCAKVLEKPVRCAECLKSFCYNCFSEAIGRRKCPFTGAAIGKADMLKPVEEVTKQLA